MNSDFEAKLNMFFEKNQLTIGTMEEFKKGQNDFKIWGDGIIYGSKNWITNKLCNKLTEIDASNLSIMKTFRNSGNQKSDLTNFTATIQAVLNNGSMAGYYIGRIDESLYGLFGYRINTNETELTETKSFESNKEPNGKEDIHTVATSEIEENINTENSKFRLSRIFFKILLQFFQIFRLRLPKLFVSGVMNEAVILQNSKDFKKSAELLEILIKNSPDHPYPYYYLGRCYLELSKVKEQTNTNLSDKYAESFKHFVKLSKNLGGIYKIHLWEAYFELGLHNLKQKLWGYSALDFENTLKYNIDFDALMHCANTFHLAGNENKSFKYALKAFEIKPDDKNAVSQLIASISRADKEYVYSLAKEIRSIKIGDENNDLKVILEEKIKEKAVVPEYPDWMTGIPPYAQKINVEEDREILPYNTFKCPICGEYFGQLRLNSPDVICRFNYGMKGTAGGMPQAFANYWWTAVSHCGRRFLVGNSGTG
jgi:tetratricopeptide (TPR) repeat protein